MIIVFIKPIASIEVRLHVPYSSQETQQCPWRNIFEIRRAYEALAGDRTEAALIITVRLGPGEK